jgi:hypothetical protein
MAVTNMAPNVNPRLHRTQRGVKEIRKKTHVLTQCERLILALVDGESSIDVLKRKLSGVIERRFRLAVADLRAKASRSGHDYCIEIATADVERTSATTTCVVRPWRSGVGYVVRANRTGNRYLAWCRYLPTAGTTTVARGASTQTGCADKADGICADHGEYQWHYRTARWLQFDQSASEEGATQPLYPGRLLAVVCWLGLYRADGCRVA